MRQLRKGTLVENFFFFKSKLLLVAWCSLRYRLVVVYVPEGCYIALVPSGCLEHGIKVVDMSLRGSAAPVGTLPATAEEFLESLSTLA